MNINMTYRSLTAIFVILILLLPLAGCFDKPASMPDGVKNASLAGIEISAEPGVSARAVEEATLAAKATVYFYRSRYNISLPKKTKILLTKDAADYARALNRELGVSYNTDAQWHAKHSIAVAHRSDLVICNVAKMDDFEKSLFAISHELTHIYTDQLSRSKFPDIRWLTEGTADLMAANIVEMSGKGKVSEFEREWLKRVKQAPHKFDLNDIATAQGFRKAMETDGAVAYCTANIAVMALVDKVGYKTLLDYYQFLGKTAGTAQGAFFTVFGVNSNSYRQDYANYLANH